MHHEALRERTTKSEIMKNKKLNKNEMNWRGRILPTVQQKLANFSVRWFVLDSSVMKKGLAVPRIQLKNCKQIPICYKQQDTFTNKFDISSYTFLMPGVLKYPTKQIISVWLYCKKGLVETSNIPEKFPGDLIK